MKNIITLLSILILISCGVRKSSVNINDKKIETKQSEVVQNNLTTDFKLNVDEKKLIDSTSEVVSEKTTYTPIDNSKPAIFSDDTGVVRTLNNTSFTQEKTRAKVDKKVQLVQKRQKTVKIIDLGIKSSDSNIKENEHSKTKDTFNFPLWWLWFLLLIPIGYFAWKYSNRLV